MTENVNTQQSTPVQQATGNSTSTNKPSLVLPILTIVFAILGILFLGFIFIPIAFICTIFCTVFSFKNKNGTYIGLTVLCWVLTILGFFLSPVLLAIIFGSAAAISA